MHKRLLQLARLGIRRLLRRDPLPALLARGLSVGRNFYMQDDCCIDASHCWHIRIGDDVTLGPRVMLLAHDASTKRALGLVRLGKLEIGDRVFIGAGSIVLPGIRIGSDVIIAAGSVVSRDVPDGQLVAGNPAKIIGTSAEYLARQQALRESVPVFGEAYTLRGGVSSEMKAQMNQKMKDGVGFIE